LDESQLETAASKVPVPQALERWGPFERMQRVGRGGFGEVYRAFDPTLQRYVALKLLLPRGVDRESESRALVAEARAMARIRHPNVVPIFGVDEHDGRVGFWSDFVQGTTLEELVALQGPLGPREAALVGIDVCRATGAVHAAGFIHRDIKAGNVMREEGGRILLMDFGLTHASGSLAGPSGTPAYMAPELLTGEPATVSSDVYAIGVLLFNLLTGQYPVDGADFDGVRRAHAGGTRRTLLDARPDLPLALAQVVEKAVHHDPGKRFASTGQLAAALSEAIGMGTAAAAEPPPGVGADDARSFRKSGRPLAGTNRFSRIWSFLKPFSCRKYRALAFSAPCGTRPTISDSMTFTPHRAASRFTVSKTRYSGVLV